MLKSALLSLAGLMLVAGAASAAPGVATGNVNLRTGPGTGYARVATIPAGARVEVLRCARWCEVVHAGRRGWASAAYISQAYRGVPRGRTLLPPDRSLCHGPQAWSLPYCETPLERSVREFNRSTREHQHRQQRRR